MSNPSLFEKITKGADFYKSPKKNSSNENDSKIGKLGDQSTQLDS